MKNPQLVFDADERDEKVSGLIPESWQVLRDPLENLQGAEEKTPVASRSADRKMDGKNFPAAASMSFKLPTSFTLTS